MKARSSMHADASRQAHARAEGQQHLEQKVDGRVLELIVRELSADLGADAEGRGGHSQQDASRRVQAVDAALAPPSGKAEPQMPQPTAGARPEQVSPAVKAQAAAALIERIETFVRSQRPALSLSVGGGIDARIEVERTGKNEVALRVIGKRGPPAPDDVARIREALSEKGLRLSHLSVG